MLYRTKTHIIDLVRKLNKNTNEFYVNYLPNYSMVSYTEDQDE